MRLIADVWAQRTPRERMLAMAVAGLVAVFAVLLGVRGAWRMIGALDDEISRLQTNIVNYQYQIARRQAVEARYEEVAAQHSSAWSESEIRDRLRQEIYRLRYRNPPRLDANGIPLSTESEGELLVRIPELRGGRLVEGGEGFRAYQIEFDVEPAPFPDMLAYLEFLQGSPQSLRMDRISLRRDPMRPEVDARILLTRVVVDDPSGGSELAQSAPGDTGVLEPEQWQYEGCTVEKVTEGQEAVLRFTGTESESRAYLVHALPAGGVYDLQVEVVADVEVSVGWGTGLDAGSEARTHPAGQEYQRYHMQWRVPTRGSGPVTIHAPYLAWSGADTMVKVRNLRFTPWEALADGT